MELRDALTQISEIRRQVARTEVFRGYCAMPIAFSGLLALGAAGFQAVWIPDPAAHLTVYRALWVGTAVLSAVAAGSEMVNHARDSASPLAREITWLAIEQFIPRVMARGLLTIVLERSALEVLWILPGLWQILYRLGLFASCRLLPRATSAVALFIPRHGAGLPGPDAGRCRLFPLGDGPALRRRPAPGGGRDLPDPGVHP